MSIRAGILVTGTEVLTGLIADRNGPWISQRLTELGVEVAEIAIVGDRPADLRAAIAAMNAADLRLICTSGGLGPTDDDLTAEVVAEIQRRPLALDAQLEQRIWTKLEPVIKRWPNISADAIRRANRKQALVPHGATVLEPVGTAPGLIVPAPTGERGATILVLPGPPRELQSMWPSAVAAPTFRSAIAGTIDIRTSILRIYGIPESEIAETMRLAREEGVEIDRLEITTCIRRAELEIVTRAPHALNELHDRWIKFVTDCHSETLFSTDGATIDAIVAAALTAADLTIATAESCTGGLLAARLTARPGASSYLHGGLVVYANDAKTRLAAVPPATIANHGAVSSQVAEALARGAQAALASDIGVGITGVAGPGGGSDEKPIGTVFLAVAGPDGAVIAERIAMPGTRDDVRERAVTVAMHLIRRALRP